MARWPPRAGTWHDRAFQGQLFRRAHSRTSKFLRAADDAQVNASQAQPFCLAHWRMSRCPPMAAASHVLVCQGHEFSLDHRRTSKRPARAAAAQVTSFQRQPLSLAGSDDLHRQHQHTLIHPRDSCSPATTAEQEGSLPQPPLSAASEQALSPHGQPFSLANCNEPILPKRAKVLQIVFRSRGRPHSKLSHS